MRHDGLLQGALARLEDHDGDLALRFRRVRRVARVAGRELRPQAGALVQRIRTRGALRRADYDETGIRIEADVPPDLAAEIETYIRTS